MERSSIATQFKVLMQALDFEPYARRRGQKREASGKLKNQKVELCGESCDLVIKRASAPNLITAQWCLVLLVLFPA